MKHIDERVECFFELTKVVLERNKPLEKIVKRYIESKLNFKNLTETEKLQNTRDYYSIVSYSKNVSGLKFLAPNDRKEFPYYCPEFKL